MSSGDYVVFLRRRGELSPVEVATMATVGDLKESAGVSKGSMLQYQGSALSNADVLADVGIGPQAVVEMLDVEIPESEKEMVVAGAGSEEVNGLYELLDTPVNGGMHWRKKDDHELVIHWYWGPVMNGVRTDSWLLGRPSYPVSKVYYYFAGRVDGKSAVRYDFNQQSQTVRSLDDVPMHVRCMPPAAGWQTCVSYNSKEMPGADPPPRLYGHNVLSPDEYEGESAE
eukprot:TRINITY_DN3689_c0_g1_i3.p2 TRINITY_DN3689_c0_g1~~TRINITY_DN3689_c0_g1_i3.p2  ORF type:complete len:227 (+),score=57.76 TRINITY_DN3689_c0_g1_i3:79-759(+)